MSQSIFEKVVTEFEALGGRAITRSWVYHREMWMT